jgi:hypothetical protein
VCVYILKQLQGFEVLLIFEAVTLLVVSNSMSKITNNKSSVKLTFILELKVKFHEWPVHNNADTHQLCFLCLKHSHILLFSSKLFSIMPSFGEEGSF